MALVTYSTPRIESLVPFQTVDTPSTTYVKSNLAILVSFSPFQVSRLALAFSWNRCPRCVSHPSLSLPPFLGRPFNLAATTTVCLQRLE